MVFKIEHNLAVVSTNILTYSYSFYNLEDRYSSSDRFRATPKQINLKK